MYVLCFNLARIYLENMVRGPYYDKYGVKKGAWSEEEDQKLRDYIHKSGSGHWNWRELPKFAGLSRCGKSCRLRWVNYLQPNVRRGNYSAEEEDMIIKLHDDLGSRWSMMAAQLPGRTDNEIKNYWHTHLKNRDKKNRKATGDKEKQNREWEAEGNNMVESNIPSNNYQILESSPLSPETPQHQIPESPELPSTSHYEQAKWVSEETMITTYEQFTGDFWTEPFVPDTGYLAPAFMEGSSCISPYASYNGGTDTLDLFYQVMQELQENTSYLSFD